MLHSKMYFFLLFVIVSLIPTCYSDESAKTKLSDTSEVLKALETVERFIIKATSKESQDCTGFKCNDGVCLYKHAVCDGKEDCMDGSDEKECCTHNGVTHKNDFVCPETCIGVFNMTWTGTKKEGECCPPCVCFERGVNSRGRGMGRAIELPVTCPLQGQMGCLFEDELRTATTVPGSVCCTECESRPSPKPTTPIPGKKYGLTYCGNDDDCSELKKQCIFTDMLFPDMPSGKHGICRDFNKEGESCGRGCGMGIGSGKCVAGLKCEADGDGLCPGPGRRHPDRPTRAPSDFPEVGICINANSE